MAKPGKRYRGDLEKVKDMVPVTVAEAVAKVKSFGPTKYDQSVDLCVHLGVDPKHADQNVRGSVSLPHGTGKTKRVIAFCNPDKVDDAKAGGAIEAGGEDLVKKVEEGWMDFDVAIASPDMMRVVSKLGRVLGPRGLMPSPKGGTVTPDVGNAVKEYAAGKVEFRNDAGGNVHVPVGKLGFDGQKLVENIEHFMAVINKMRPSTTKGQYVKRISLSGTMTPGVDIEL